MGKTLVERFAHPELVEGWATCGELVEPSVKRAPQTRHSSAKIQHKSHLSIAMAEEVKIIKKYLLRNFFG